MDYKIFVKLAKEFKHNLDEMIIASTNFHLLPSRMNPWNMHFLQYRRLETQLMRYN
jgi:hypothetical protein